MLHLCIGELADVVGGQLTLGSLPPLAGAFEPVRRVVVDSFEARPGDVYWALTGRGYDGARLADSAFLRGALGVVVAGRHVEPWAGRFSIQVPDANVALLCLADRLRGAPTRLRRRRRTTERADSTTQLVHAMLEGVPVGLDSLIARIPHGMETVLA